MTLYFLSDYGLEDEFVGVVHAVLDRLAPGVPVVDLTHGVAPFDVAAGAAALARCAPFLGAGAVVAVVDPGVGTDRRSVAVEVDPGRAGPQWLVGPDNGLLLPAADVLGGARSVVVLDPPRLPAAAVRPATTPATTFDGRDVFAPAAAHLVTGGDPGLLGGPSEVASLVPGPVSAAVADQVGRDEHGVRLATSVVGVDRFGNVQLAATAPALVALGLGVGDTVSVSVSPGHAPGDGPGVGTRRHRPDAASAVTATVVRAFAACPAGGLGLLVDAAGHLALVAARASAADHLAAGGGAGPFGLVGAEVRLERGT